MSWSRIASAVVISLAVLCVVIAIWYYAVAVLAQRKIEDIIMKNAQDLKSGQKVLPTMKARQ